MVPFYGQGMNAGLEDVRVLFDFLDRHPAEGRAAALAEYTMFRTPDAHTINDLALRNYEEMRSGVTSPVYKARKWVEERMSVWWPGTADDVAPTGCKAKGAENGTLGPTKKSKRGDDNSSSSSSSGWATQYSRVSFGNERYSDVWRRVEWQGKVLGYAAAGVGVGMVGVVAGTVAWGLRRRR